MTSSPNLRVPGPTPVPDEVAAAGARPMVNHRGPEFAAIMADVAAMLPPFFGTKSDVLLLTASGTGAQEAAIVNVLSPGDEVLATTCGFFGDRFAAIAETFGVKVQRLDVEWGTAVDASALEERLTEAPQVRAVLITHNETSTGVTNDLAALAAAVRRSAPQALVIVDGVSSIGALPFAMDEWDVDLALTGSQKAWMSPPGISMIALSERAWAAQREATMPRYYWDLAKARKDAQKGTTPYTPAVGVVHALHEALRLMTQEGPQQVFARHRRIGNWVREGMATRGLELFADPSVASDTVTAVCLPPEHASSLIQRLRDEHGVVVGGGQDRLRGRIFRIGHMGWVTDEDIDGVLAALKATLAANSIEGASSPSFTQRTVSPR